MLGVVEFVWLVVREMKPENCVLNLLAVTRLSLTDLGMQMSQAYIQKIYCRVVGTELNAGPGRTINYYKYRHGGRTSNPNKLLIIMEDILKLMGYKFDKIIGARNLSLQEPFYFQIIKTLL